MLDFLDSTETVNEPKSARLEQRAQPRVKAVIERAAILVGRDTSDFVVSAAYNEALATLDRMKRTELNADQTARFFQALDNASGPLPVFDALVKRYMESVENPIRR